jgi:L-aspartate semialdehyde sulfurtransferase ferredoxin
MKRRYIFHFPPEIINLPLTYTLVKDFDIKVNILNADLSAGRTGKLVMELDAEKDSLDRALEFIGNSKIGYTEIKKQLTFKENLCVACGACTAVCFSGALVQDRGSWEIHFDPENCILCGLCVSACPLKLFTLETGRYV